MQKGSLQPVKSWTLVQLFSFRVLFLFLSLKILTSDSFWSYLILTEDYITFSLVSKWFTPFYLWLNQKVFHFKYESNGWTDFTSPLRVAQGVFYISISILATIVWHFSFKQIKTHNKLSYWFNHFLSISLSLSLFTYGIIKVFPIQMPPISWVKLNTTIDNLTSFDLLWSALGYGVHFQVFIGAFEILAAILLLFSRTRILGLLLSLTMLLNIVILNYSFSVPALHFSLFLLSIVVYLIVPHLSNLYKFFILQQTVSFEIPKYRMTSSWKKYFLTTFTVILIAESYSVNTLYAINQYQKQASLQKNTKIYGVTNFTLNGDSSLASLPENIRWHSIIESSRNNKPFFTVITQDLNATYYSILQQDSLNNILILKSRNTNDTATFIIKYKNIAPDLLQIQTQNNSSKISATLKRIHKDSLTLFKKKPSFWEP